MSPVKVWPAWMRAAASGDAGRRAKSLSSEAAKAFMVDPSALQEEDWPAPEPLVPPVLAPPLDALPRALGDYIKAVSAEKQTPPDLALLAVLAGLSAATRGAYRVTPVVGWEEALSLYTVSMLPSGGRKTAVMKSVMEPFWRVQAELRAEAKDEQQRQQVMYQLAAKRAKDALNSAIKGEGSDEEAAALALKAEELKPGALPVLIIKDSTPEATAIEMERQGGSVAVFAAEGGFLANLGGRYSDGRANLDLVNEAYDGEPYVSRRVNREDVSITRPFLALALSMQPAIAAGLASREMDGSGFLGRFAYAVPRNTVGSRTTDTNPMPFEVLAAWEDGVRAMLAASTKLLREIPRTGEYRQEIRLSKRAGSLLTAFRTEHEPRLDEETGDLAHIASWASKLPGLLVRIATLFSLFEKPSASALVSGEAMKAALALAPYLIEHAGAAYAIMRNPWEPVAGRHPILAWIREGVLGPPFEFSHTEVFQAVRKQSWARGSGGSDKVRAALGKLVDAGWLRRTSVPRGEGEPGRPAERYRTHPDLRGRVS